MKAPGLNAISSRNGAVARCVVVDDHPIVRRGLVQLLADFGDVAVLGEGGTVTEARDLVERLQPDLVLIDLMLRQVSALGFLKDLRARFPEVRALVISMMDETVYGPRVLQAGAHGFIMKDASSEELRKAVRTVAGGGCYLGPDLAARVTRDQALEAEDSLTDRELQVFEMLGRGLAVKEIAAELSISPRTVDAHKEHIKSKLEVGSSAELARRAMLWLDSKSR